MFNQKCGEWISSINYVYSTTLVKRVHYFIQKLLLISANDCAMDAIVSREDSFH